MMGQIVIIENNNSHPVLKNHFDCLEWVTRAVCRDKGYTVWYQTVCVRDGICACTDGFRLHLYAQGEELPDELFLGDGIWTIKSNTRKNIILERSDIPLEQYPDFWRVFCAAPQRIGNFLAGPMPKGDDVDFFDQFVCNLLVKYGRMFRLRYLRDAFLYDRYFAIEKHNLNDMLVMGNDTCIAAIMPLRDTAESTQLAPYDLSCVKSA
ncbi:MAG TPA: hypothetical protein P5244_04540 [Syntrophales bacterium]|nr:hypothetical protein [Syntrophales bacterium]HRR40483.1 hypothetical protein [Syntrophales bacterium]